MPVFFNVPRRTAAVFLAFALFAIMLPAVAGDKPADAVRKQFTAAQWKQLMSLKRTAVILPAHLPAGYRVARVEVSRLRDNPSSEGFQVFYSNGVRTLSWGGSNWTAGGDPEPDAFQATWKSPTLGNGIVFMIKGVAGRRGPDGQCWTTNERLPNGHTDDFAQYQAAGHHSFFMLQACDPGLAPTEVANMMSSTVVLKK
jgi:hypothetical protein